MATEAQQIRTMLNMPAVPAGPRTFIRPDTEDLSRLSPEERAQQPGVEEFAFNPTNPEGLTRPEQIKGRLADSPLTAAPPLPPRSDSASLDNAIIEQLTEGQNTDIEVRVADNAIKQGAFDSTSDTVRNVVIEGLKKQKAEGLITGTLAFELLEDPTVSDERKRAILMRAIRASDIQKTLLKDWVATSMVIDGYGSLPSSAILRTQQLYTTPEWVAMKERFREPLIEKVRHARDAFVAGLGIENHVLATLDATAQELTPVLNVVSKWVLNNQVMVAMGMPHKDTSKILLGEMRQAMREWLTEASDEERLERLGAFIAEIERMQGDEALSYVIREFGVLELSEAVLTDEVISGRSADGGWDRTIGNFEMAAEALFGAFLIKGAIKGIKRLYNVTDAMSTASRIARQTGARELQTTVNNSLRGTTAERHGATATEVDTALDMPRPSQFVDERTVQLPGVAEAIERTDRLVGVLKETSTRRLHRVLGASGREQATRSLESTMQLGDNVEVIPSMSLASELDDGVRIRAVIAQTGEQPWNSIEEMIPDILALDPNLERFTILRRNNEGLLETVDIDAERLARLATGVEKMPPATVGMKDEFFLEFDHFRAYHPLDKMTFGTVGYRSSVIPRALLTPNAKFGDNIYGAFQDAHLTTARTNRLMDLVYKPYYKLGVKDKRQVAEYFEWAEEFGKNNEIDPTLWDYYSQFPDMTPKQMSAVIGLKRGMEVQFDLFNERLFREMQGMGFSTIRPKDAALPRYHGKVLDRTDIPKGVHVLDPETGEIRRLSAIEVEAAYNGGGGIVKLDVAVSATGKSGTVKTTHILADGDIYTVGPLSTAPLEHYAGFTYRFYDNPFFINKVYREVELDGRLMKGSTTEAFRTAESTLDAERYLARIATQVKGDDGVLRWIDKKDGKTEYSFTRAHDLNQTDRVLAQKQTFQREGRMFWDSRQRDALPDTYSRATPVLDFTEALEKGTRLANKQNAEEDVMRATKNAFNEDYGKGSNRLVDPLDIKIKGISQVISDLKGKLTKAVEKTERARIEGALEIAKYIRMMDGVDSAAITIMRGLVERVAVGITRFVHGKGFKSFRTGGVEKWAQQMNPVQSSKSLAFTLFMVLRAPRQALLQAVQPLFLTGIDPLYVLSGKGLSDAVALRIGLAKLNKAGLADTGYSSTWARRLMGLDKEEYKLVLEHLEKSGVVDIIDAHSFSGGSISWQRSALPKGGDLTSHAWYGVKAGLNGATDILKRYGFDLGESINKLGSYNVAWRRVMKQKGYKSVKEFSESDWKQVIDDTENLSLAMSKPNAAGYQSGLISVSTQFLAFSHKVLLTLIGQNPALSKAEAAKVWIASMGIFGANVVGMKEEAYEYLSQAKLAKFADETIGFGGETLVDFISAGLLQTTVNRITQALGTDNIETENFTPILNLKQIISMYTENYARSPLLLATGPFGNRVAGMWDAVEFAALTAGAGEMTGDPQGSLLRIMDMAARKILPQYNDITNAYMAYQFGKMYRSSGEHIAISPDNWALFLRGAFGIRTLEEGAAWSLIDKIYDNDGIVRDMVRAGRERVTQEINLYRQGTKTKQDFMDIARMIAMMASVAPEGRVQEVIEGIWLPYFDDDDPEKGLIEQLVDATIDRKLTAGEVLALLQHLNATPEEDTLLRTFVEDVFDEEAQTEEEMRQFIIRSNPRRRD